MSQKKEKNIVTGVSQKPTCTPESNKPSVLDAARQGIWHMLDTRAVTKARAQGVDYKRIVVVCRRGQQLADNPKYIVEALQRLYPSEYDYVLLAQEPEASLPAYVRWVDISSRNARVELARARLWIANVRTNWPIDKTADQIYLQTWHASMGPKRSEASAEEKFSEGYLEIAKRDGAFTDFMFANDNVHAQAFANDYWQAGPVLRCGAPRNRPLVHYSPQAAQIVREELGVPTDHGLLLYSPTFRNAKELSVHLLDLQACAQALQKRFDCPFSIAYRLHAEVAQGAKDELGPAYLDGCINATHYPDVQQLLCATDVLISDYSSILEDFLLLGRPCFTYAPDLEAYLQERGLYYPLDMRPAPLAQTESSLIGAIENYDHAQFLKQRDTFFAKLDVTEDGNGDEVLAQVIHVLMPQGSNAAAAIAQCKESGIFSAAQQLRGTAPSPKPAVGPLNYSSHANRQS